LSKEDILLFIMDETEINKLFMSIAENAGQMPDEVRKVFSSLVSTTLSYRDHLKQDTGIIVTVEDVRVALGWLLESMRTQQLPPTGNAVRLDLVKLWLDELKAFL
jgi:hypothetical protein